VLAQIWEPISILYNGRIINSWPRLAPGPAAKVVRLRECGRFRNHSAWRIKVGNHSPKIRYDHVPMRPRLPAVSCFRSGSAAESCRAAAESCRAAAESCRAAAGSHFSEVAFLGSPGGAGDGINIIMPYSDIDLPEVVPIFSNTFGAPEGGCV
jgi:hypothetical protein